MSTFSQNFPYKKTNFQGGEPISQTPELIQELQETNNKESWAVEVQMDSILEGYIIEFPVDATKSYSKAERVIFNGPKGRFLLSLQLSIKMLVCEKGIVKMHLEQQNYGLWRWWISRRKGGDEWKDKGQMGASFDETLREAKEESGFMRRG